MLLPLDIQTRIPITALPTNLVDGTFSVIRPEQSAARRYRKLAKFARLNRSSRTLRITSRPSRQQPHVPGRNEKATTPSNSPPSRPLCNRIQVSAPRTRPAHGSYFFLFLSLREKERESERAPSKFQRSSGKFPNILVVQFTPVSEFVLLPPSSLSALTVDSNNAAFFILSRLFNCNVSYTDAGDYNVVVVVASFVEKKRTRNIFSSGRQKWQGDERAGEKKKRYRKE